MIPDAFVSLFFCHVIDSVCIVLGTSLGPPVHVGAPVEIEVINEEG